MAYYPLAASPMLQKLKQKELPLSKKQWEREELQNSAFTKNLLSGLNDWEADTDDDGYITADELGTYLRKSVTEDSDFKQTPQKGRFRNSGNGEFMFFNDVNISISTIKRQDELLELKRKNTELEQRIQFLESLQVFYY